MKTLDFNGESIIINLPDGTVLDIHVEGSSLHVDHRLCVGAESNGGLNVHCRLLKDGTYYLKEHSTDEEECTKSILNENYDYSVDSGVCSDIQEGIIWAIRNIMTTCVTVVVVQNGVIVSIEDH